MPETPPVTQVRTKAQLLGDFFGGQESLIKLRNLIETIFDGATQSTQTWLTTDGQRAQSTRDRASQEVNVSEFTGYDPGGSGATNHTAIASAWAAMIARGRSRVILPPGAYRLGESLTLEKTFVDGTRCELVGAGPGVTSITGPASATNVINIGNEAGAQTGNIGLRKLQVAPGAVQTGYAVAVHNSRDVILEEVNPFNTANGFGIGIDALSSATKCQGITILNCSGKLKANAAGAWLRVVAGDFVKLFGGRSGGRVDQYFFEHSGTISSADGVYIVGHVSELWGQAIRSTGPGLVNFHLDCDQFDRAINFIYVVGPSGSSNRDWQVRSQFLGEGAGADHEDAACHFDATNGIIEAIEIFSSAFDGRKGPVGRFIGSTMQDRGPYVIFNGGVIRDCGNGNGGVPLFEVGEDANPQFYGMMVTQGLHALANDPYTYFANYGGASTGRRQTEAQLIASNTILDFATGVTNGTP